MGKNVIRCFLAGVVLNFLWLDGCGSSGSSKIDLNGTFRWSLTISQTSCGGATGEVRTADITIEQDGDSLRFMLPMTRTGTDAWIGGTLDGNQVLAAGLMSAPPWSLVINIAATVGGSGNSLEGTTDLVWANSDNGRNCTEHGPFTATRI